MIEIRKLEQYSFKDRQDLDLNGYVTGTVYKVCKTETEYGVSMNLVVETLDEPYKKTWTSNPETHDAYGAILAQGLSFGAYEDDCLVGILVVSEIKWNNTLWIENIGVAKSHRGKGVSRQLINALVEVAREKDIRLIGLETQSTNYPAIQCYLRNGFAIEGVDFSLYPVRDERFNEVAILMKRHIVEEAFDGL